MAATTSAETLLALIPTLTAEQKEAVDVFIRYLRDRELPTPITADEAFEEFVSRHSELLRLLAQ